MVGSVAEGASAPPVMRERWYVRLQRARWDGKRINWSAYLFIAPFLVPFLIFIVATIGFGVYVSFTDWGIIGSPKWVGLANYSQAFHDPWVPKVWGNTLHYGLMVVPAVTIVALGFALYVNQRWAGSAVARTIFYAPNAVSVTVIGLVWVWMLDTQFGVVNQYLGKFGVAGIPWLTNPRWALLGIGLASVWWDVGFNMVILLAGLQNIPNELREAALIDGANRFQILRYVVLPLLRPALSLVVTLEVIAALRVFSQIYIMTNGGPAGASASVIQYVYEIGFTKYKLGYASALSLMLFATILVVTLIQLRIFRENVQDA
ncbi:MAG: sugar ABC transporter permease [Thermomicrobia bacterium]|nr:sugar ABC transporter permease [Thermomicrobia bacterium]MCA1724495.1 sugar ABC transporter permease [Thermomicrobia bacterium]